MKRREKIINKALELFNIHGFHEVGVRQIARALAISPGNLSYHFSKKEDILFELLKEYSKNNDRLFEAFFEEEPTLENFLDLMRSMLKSQYKHRGIFLTSSILTEDFRNQDRTGYKDTVLRRKQGINRILDSLILNKQIEANPEQIEFLIAFMSLFARFSIQEAFFLHKKREEKEIIQYYMQMLSTQFSLFATTKGKASIKTFHQKHLQ